MVGFSRHIFVCLNERAPTHPKGCCKHRGSLEIFAYLKKRVTELGLNRAMRVNQAGCMDHCEHGPTVVVYPEAVWYRLQTLDDAKEFLESHLVAGKIVERLRVKEPEEIEGTRETQLS